MPKYNVGLRVLDVHFDLLIRSVPVTMVSCKPSLRRIEVKVLFDVVLIGRKQPVSGVAEIQLHNGQAWGVSRRMYEADAWCEADEVAGEGFPVQMDVEVLRQVGT